MAGWSRLLLTRRPLLHAPLPLRPLLLQRSHSITRIALARTYGHTRAFRMEESSAAAATSTSDHSHAVASPSASPLPAPSSCAPLASIGLLSDIQYADLDDGHNFMRTERRYYRHALEATRRAVDQFASWRCAAVLHLGDLVDGFNATTLHADDHPHHPGQPLNLSAVRDVLAVLPPVATTRVIPTHGDDIRCYHLTGNHELMNHPRSRWAHELGMGALAEDSIREAEERRRQRRLRRRDSHSESESVVQRSFMFPTQPHESQAEAAESSGAVAGASASSAKTYSSASPLYYSLQLGAQFRILMLDSFELSVTGYSDCESHPHRLAAVAFLDRENPNVVKFSPDNLVGTERRKVAFNGGISEKQLEWARSVLEECREQGQYSLLCSHVAFHPGASHCSALLWNNDELLQLVADFKGTVVACLHGHDHDGGHCVDENGVVHHTVPGILTTPVGSDAYNRLDFFSDRIEVTGAGRGKSFLIPLPQTAPERKQNQSQTEQTDTADEQQ